MQIESDLDYMPVILMKMTRTPCPGVKYFFLPEGLAECVCVWGGGAENIRQ